MLRKKSEKRLWMAFRGKIMHMMRFRKKICDERSPHEYERVGRIGLMVATLAIAPNVFADCGPQIFDWGINQGTPTSSTVPVTDPIPWLDQYSFWNDANLLKVYQTYQFNAGKCVGFLVRGEEDGPAINYVYQYTDSGDFGYYWSDGYISKTVNGTAVTPYFNQTEANYVLAEYPKIDSGAVSSTANWLSTNIGRLDYVFMDFEFDDHLFNGRLPQDVDVQTTVQQIRAVFPNAMIGNYGDFPGTQDLSELYPIRIDRTNYWAFDRLGIQSDRNAAYLNGGLNVAMPSLYPYSFYMVHASSAWDNFEGQNFVSPNQRSALFWAPLEKLSTAKRALPPGHQLIPWITDFVQWSGYNLDSGQTPTIDDNKASVMHYRLRGADGYYVFLSTMGMDTYRAAVYNAWTSLDPLFNRPGAQRVLNLATNKIGGIEWSGVVKNNRVWVLVSNLNTVPQLVDWSAKPQLPAESPLVAPDTHLLLQYRTNYLDNNNMQGYVLGNAMNNQGANSWSGPQPSAFMASATPGTGDVSSQAVVSRSPQSVAAWDNSANPGFTSTDKVVYSAWLYEVSGSIGFEPVNTDGTSPAGLPDGDHRGPWIGFNGSALELDGGSNNDIIYEAANFAPAPNRWYEVQLVVDQSGTGLATVFVRDVTDGQADFTRIMFDNTRKKGVAERLWQVPLELGNNNNPTVFDGWLINASAQGNAIDNLNTGYYIPRIDDNFEHYETGVTNNLQPTPEIQWYGPTTQGPAQWTVAAPYGTGNSSSLAVTPTSVAYTPKAWWTTERPDYTSREPVVYSGELYGTSGVGFEAVNTTGSAATQLTPNNQIGFYTSIYWGKLRFRASRDNGDVYQTTNFTAQTGKWYDVQVQIDPTQTIAGSPAGDYGVARVWVKDLTDNTQPVLLTFDNLSTTSTVESLTELPMFLTSNQNNPTLWNGWEVYGYDSGVQIDRLRSFLFPYTDFEANNQYIE